MGGMGFDLLALDTAPAQFRFDNLERRRLHAVSVHGDPVQQVFTRGISSVSGHSFRVEFQHARLAPPESANRRKQREQRTRRVSYAYFFCFLCSLLFLFSFL